MSTLYYTNFREFLQDQYAQKTGKNSAYSLRAFARDLGLSPALLSRYLRGERGLSPKSAEKILARFKLDRIQKKFLIHTIVREYARSKVEKDQALEALKQLNSSAYRILKDDQFAVMKEWYHMAILALVELPDFQFDLQWIANKLRINVELASVAVSRLISLGILRKEADKLSIDGSYFIDPRHLPNGALRAFHRQVLDKAATAIESQTTRDRDVSTLMMSVDSSQLEEARAFIAEFREAFDRRFSMSVPHASRDAVFAFAVQFFRVTDAPEPQQESARDQTHSA